MSEEFFIKRLRNREEQAYRELVEQYSDMLYATAYSLVQNEMDAEDLTQECFVEISTAIYRFKGESKLSTWMYRIITNLALYHLRSKKRKKRFGFLFSIDDHENVNNPIHKLKISSTPYQVLEQKEKNKILFAALEKLPENQRIAFVLFNMEQQSYKEICDIMQLSLSAVESLIFRAKQNLRKQLASIYDGN
ncbi:MAG: RNA polymerase sigma factor [Bacteroidota bacterium]